MYSLCRRKDGSISLRGGTTADAGRASSLGIPPAWTDVRVAADPNAYLQATGVAENGKTQYIYHPVFVQLAARDKFKRLWSFCERVPLLLERLQRDPSEEAIILRIMIKSNARVGHTQYSTYGASTIQKRHVKRIDDRDGTVVLDFVGKSGMPHHVEFRDRRVAKALRERCAKARGPTAPLFQCSSEQINDHLRSIVGEEFTCKDLRTYSSNILFISLLCGHRGKDEEEPPKRFIKRCYQEVAKRMGHTEAVDKKSYVVPEVAELFMERPELFTRSTDPEKILQRVIRAL